MVGFISRADARVPPTPYEGWEMNQSCRFQAANFTSSTKGKMQHGRDGASFQPLNVSICPMQVLQEAARLMAWGVVGSRNCTLDFLRASR